MQKKSIVLVICLLALALAPGKASAEWVDLAQDETKFSVLEDSDQRIVVEFTLAGMEREPVAIEGVTHDMYVAPGLPLVMNAGEPQLPIARRALRIEDRGAVRVRILEMDTELVLTNPVVPSKGHLTRNIDPATVPYAFGDVYRQSGFYPAERAALDEPFIIRDFRGTILELHPVVYDHEQGILEVASRIRVEIVPAEGPTVNEIDGPAGVRAVDREFASIYENFFLNNDPGRYQMIPEIGRCIIVYHEDFQNAANTLYQWKLQQGVPTMLVSKSDVGTTANQFMAYFQNLYNAPDGLTYIILIGESNHIPYFIGYNGSESDPCYTKLAGGDHYFDAVVSRISAQNAAQAETQIAKTIRYERYPDTGQDADWYHKAIGIGSAEGEWSGYTDCERTELIMDLLLGYTYTQVTQICDPGATSAMVTAAVNEGSTVLNYIGHGSGTSWGTTGFSNTRVHQLTNGSKNVFICDVACSNGTFTMGECFAEAWLRTGSVESPRGAVAFYGSAGLCSWVPPTTMQYEVNRLLTAEERHTVGGVCFNGSLHAYEVEGNAGREVAEQYHIFGDCTMMLRTDVPAPMTVEHAGSLPVGEAAYDVSVPGVEDALVCLYANGVQYGAAFTDFTGDATIPLTQLPAEGTQLILTATAYNHVTVEEPVIVEEASLANLVIVDYAVTDAGDGTVNGQIEAGEQVSLSITVRNVGAEAAIGVTGELATGSQYVTMVNASASFGDLLPGEEATNDVPYVVDVDSTTPDGQLILFSLDLAAEVGDWQQNLGLTVHRPVLDAPDVVVDDAAGDGDGVLDPGETANLIVDLSNIGTGDAAALEVALRIGSIMVTIQQNHGELDNLPAGGQGTLTPPFVVSVQPQAGDQIVTFTLNVLGNNGFRQTAVFSLPITQESSSVEDVLAGVGDRLFLAPTYPNPAHPGTRLAYRLPNGGAVDLAVYDASGRRIATLQNGSQDAGIHHTQWDGRDADGRTVASGIYFATLRSDGSVLTRQFTVVR